MLVNELLAACAHRVGGYASAYRVGIAERVAGLPICAEITSQGYRDGWHLRPYRIRKKGAGAVARNADECRKRYAVKARMYKIAWVKKQVTNLDNL